MVDLTPVEKLAADQLMARVRRLPPSHTRVLLSILIDRIVHADGQNQILCISTENFIQALCTVEDNASLNPTVAPATERSSS
jgi:hypothetical protein